MAGAGQAALLEELRAQVAHMERRGTPVGGLVSIPFGLPDLDRTLPGDGLVTGALHEVGGTGSDLAHGAAAALFVAGILARMDGPVLWVSARFDLFAPALAGVGLAPGRVLHVEAGKAVLLAMEEGLRHPGLAGVVGEVEGRLGLTASRRLQHAAESAGAVAFVLRRPRYAGAPTITEPSAATTRWRITCLPSDPPLAWAPETPGLGQARWQIELVRARGAEPRTWIVEACDAQGRLTLAADLADGSAAAAPERQRRAG